MDGISVSAAVEIFDNPYDLVFEQQRTEYGSLGFIVTRGPEKHNKILIATSCFARSKKELLGAVKEILEAILRLGTKQLVNRHGHPFRFALEMGHERKEALTPEIIDWIIMSIHRAGTTSVVTWVAREQTSLSA